MAVPDAPVEDGGDKILFMVDGAGAAALLRSFAEATINSENVGNLGVATAEDGVGHATGQPIVLIAGDDGTNLRSLRSLVDGTLITQRAGVFAGAGHRNVAVTGTALALKSSSTPCKRVIVKADPGNAGVIYVGASNVENDETDANGGFQLSAGHSVEIEAADLDDVFINGTSGEGVSFLYWT